MFRLAAILLLLLTAAKQVQAEDFPDSYICVPDHVVGFAFENKEWIPEIFRLPNSKYLVRPKKDDDVTMFFRDATVLVFEIGENDAFAGCELDDNSDSLLECDIFPLGTFYLNRKEGKFMLVNTFGFNVGTDTPHMMIGKCSSL